jgi:menaquinone-dependent protoporphyrinogen oxidase
VRVLIAVASKHGSTREIGEAIGCTLAELGVENDVRRVDDLAEVDGYDAFVVGSAVYFGRWIEPARRFAEAFADELRDRPTWLFSSGPIGEPPHPPVADAVDIADIVAMTQPREHRLFSGSVDRTVLGFAERALLSAVRGAEGDFRDWADVASWSASIARELQGGPQPVVPTASRAQVDGP